MKKRAIAYYRVSSRAQQEKQSIVMQRSRRVKDVARLDEEYEWTELEDDGISGEAIDSRPGFQKTLELIETGEIDLLWVYMVDRIGRFKSRKDRNQVIELLEESKTNVFSPYDGPFHHDSEERMNDLEKLLNDSRADNKRRGVRVHEGHEEARKAGRPSGGKIPYGLYYTKERGYWFGEKERDTVKLILEKLIAGWGLQRVADFLNLHPQDYPKRIRKYKGKPVSKWSSACVRDIVLNDFYFTGIIEPRKEKKNLPVNTGIKLFDREGVEIARREMRLRRNRGDSPQHEPVFALLHGIARCGICGWKLGLQIQGKNGHVNWYYLCRGRNKRRCSFRSIPGRTLEREVMSRLVGTLEDPEKMKEAILRGEFLVDKDQESQKALLKKAENDLAVLLEAQERLKKQFTWGDLAEGEYREEMQTIGAKKSQMEEVIEKYREALERPIEVEQAVRFATQYLARTIGSSLKVKVKKSRPKQAYSCSPLKATRLRKSDEVQRLLFEQKRLLLQRVIDPEKGIEIKSLKDMKINFSIDSLSRSWRPGLSISLTL